MSGISWYINRPASTPSNPPEYLPGVCWYINRPASTPSNPPECLPGVCWYINRPAFTPATLFAPFLPFPSQTHIITRQLSSALNYS